MNPHGNIIYFEGTLKTSQTKTSGISTSPGTENGSHRNLAGGIAYDFNNILSALIGYGNLLHMKMDEDDPLRIYVERMLVSSEKAVNLTQSLLAFSRKQVIKPASKG